MMTEKDLAGYKALPILLAAVFLLIPARHGLSEDASQASIKVVSSADKKNTSIGDRFFYFATVLVDPDTEVEFPKADKLGSFEVRDCGLISKIQAGKKELTQWYLLTVYETGEQYIPELKVRYRHRDDAEWDSILSNKVKIQVESVFQKAKITDDIKEIEPPIRFAEEYKLHITAVALGVVLFIFICGVIIKKRMEFLKALRQGPPADEIAYQRLNSFISSLSNKKDIATADFVNLAQLTRDYLDKRFELKSGGMTTEEFLNRVRGFKDFFERYGDFLSRFLKASDLVKFASQHPDKEKLMPDINIAKKLADDIRRQE